MGFTNCKHAHSHHGTIAMLQSTTPLWTGAAGLELLALDKTQNRLRTLKMTFVLCFDSDFGHTVVDFSSVIVTLYMQNPYSTFTIFP